MSVRALIRHAGPLMVALCLLASPGTASAQVRFRVGIALPGLAIGINVPAYPHLVPVPGYPVYYAPDLDTNLFFYDGLYWVFVNDQWYSSSWYDGPWYLVEPALVPDFILRIPILYYRRPPAYFYRWNRYGAPRWGAHWGAGWEQRRRGWDRWDRRSVPRRAPLPRYQREYPRQRYPDRERQRALENRHYRYRPQDSRARRLERMPGWAGPRPTAPPARRPRENRAPGNRFAPPRQRSVPPQGQSRENRRMERAPGRAGPRSNPPRAQAPPGNRAAPQRGRAGPPQRDRHERRAPPRGDDRARRGEPPRLER